MHASAVCTPRVVDAPAQGGRPASPPTDIPVGAVAQLLVNRYLLQPDALVEQEPEGRDRRSVLRYETREFVRDVRRQARLQRPQSTAAPQAIVDNLEAIALQLSDVLATAGRASENERGES